MHKHKCASINIPQNASSSVSALFNGKGWRKQDKWHEFNESNDCFLKHYLKFSIVRKLLSWLFSANSYILKGGSESDDDITLQHIILANSDDFESLTQQVLDADFIKLQLLFQPQYLYVFNCQLELVTNTLLKYESLSSDWQQTVKQQGVVELLPKVNILNIKDVVPIVSERILAKIEQLCKLDFQLLGYALRYSQVNGL